MITAIPFPQVHQHQEKLDQGFVPAVQKEYYNYPALFTLDRPVFALMSCKSNKGRSVTDIAGIHSQEINLFFDIHANNVRLITIKSALRQGLLGSINPGAGLDETWISPIEMSIAEFNEIRFRANAEELAEVSRIAKSYHGDLVEIEEDRIIAVMTSRGKYGLLHVAGVSFPDIHIEGCHVLL